MVCLGLRLGSELRVFLHFLHGCYFGCGACGSECMLKGSEICCMERRFFLKGGLLASQREGFKLGFFLS